MEAEVIVFVGVGLVIYAFGVVVGIHISKRKRDKLGRYVKDENRISKYLRALFGL